MGWTSFSVLFLDDVYGVGYSQELASAAGTLGLTVATAQKYTSGDKETIRQAMLTIKATGVRVAVCIAFTTDLEAILHFGDEFGTSERGWIWITGDAISDPQFLETSANASRRAQQLHGWLQVTPSGFAGERNERFQAAWLREPAANLNHSLLHKYSKDALLQTQPCSQICGFAYDAVWAAAIAISGTLGTGAGQVDKEALLQRLFALDFEASTGIVSEGVRE